MTRAEVEALLKAIPGLERGERKQYEPETVRVTCTGCGTVFRVLRWQDEKPWLERHMAECAKRGLAERAFYAVHRRWPKKVRASDR